MYASTAACLLLLGVATAMPALQPRAPDATDLWVTVDESGHPKTVTPVQTTIDGTPTVISAAPNAMTATVFTNTNQGDVRTTTATVPNPTPTATGGAGAFPVCHNKDGDNAPFCLPLPGAELNPGKTYYVTWDPTIFPSSNTTVRITGSYFNSTTGLTTSQAFSSGSLAAAWSFYAWTVDSSLLSGSGAGGVNISLTIAALSAGATAMTPFQGPVVRVAKPAGYVSEKTKAPTGPALYIGLPTVLGFVAVVLIGTCWWNRKHRKIDVGSVMGRGRGYGAGKSRRQRVFGGAGKRERKEQGIRLMERDVVAGAGGEVYRDDVRPERPTIVTKTEGDSFDFGVPRRDSDALGSLAGSPTEERHPDGLGRAQKGGNGNAFRDELSRQERERF
ncbi:hypothetical protein CONLIGDRAFT_684658 [Coniochaeta ligniaria NRRL 30616]|uniref:Mid2 domain-containing protein n=1 Tax=Coniochaeta ligniaria NRRL 30616 TaxID=1408157 RepID=A0A1J7IYG1_9PEZI|nr:hypothetical protein CONLIGDRAFT_684658 [Coniochaeta ligniaria NRRL 30616]